MATQPEPTDESTPMDNLRDLARKLVKVPKSEVKELREREKRDKS